MANQAVTMAVLTSALLTGACATSQEWQIWQTHATHFASDEHLSFSIRNPDDTARHITRRDIALARSQAWWGDPVRVAGDQILER
jgi:hypothetical protein